MHGLAPLSQKWKVHFRAWTTTPPPPSLNSQCPIYTPYFRPGAEREDMDRQMHTLRQIT